MHAARAGGRDLGDDVVEVAAAPHRRERRRGAAPAGEQLVGRRAGVEWIDVDRIRNRVHRDRER